MNDFPRVSEGILGEQDTAKTNTELFLSIVGQYFPEAIKDGEVDFTALREEMGEFAEVGSEHYDFTWAGKQAAKKEAQADLFGKSLRYKPEDSLNPDTTENIYIEGDNLEALKLLRRNYHGRIKMIYIDPPYNTGSDFVYHDDFSMTEGELAELSGDVVDGVRFQKNGKDSSRYHTNWLNMMYPRLKLARELLSDNGVIFISADDNEIDNLRKICNSIFSEHCFIGQITVVGNPRGRDYGGIARMHDYVLAYMKSDKTELNLITDKENEFKMFDDLGGFELRELRNRNVKFNKENRPNLYYPFYIEPNEEDEYHLHNISLEPHEGWIELYPLESQGINVVWRWGKEKALANLNINIKAKPMRNGSYMIVEKYREGRMMARSVWWDKDTNTEKGTLAVKELLEGKIFDYPKPAEMIYRLLEMGTDSNSIVMDFFSGSATTAHAVMQLNAEGGGDRKYILVQLPEVCDENSEAAKAGYKNICEIGKERIRRAAKKIHEDNPDAQFDDGFKVFEVGKTTIRWNLMDDDELSELDRASSDTEKLDFTDGHNDTDIVYEIMLRQYGIPLSTPIEKLADVSDRTYIFADAVVVCLESEITDELIEKLADIEPTPAKFVLRDSAFGDNIEFKDFSFRKLSALIRSHQTEEERKSKYNNYTVEFI
ncbi:site-specific DNA-methyltransferase [Ruminococcus albus]|uniref:site-specific DNA-methyltransferase n=1 Tax=Ruminococcus albus TaxID=1264 RepID=UPI000465622E|nr:site-specific DNA-methyltransferase [Ruminococcus albus]